MFLRDLSKSKSSEIDPLLSVLGSCGRDVSAVCNWISDGISETAGLSETSASGSERVLNDFDGACMEGLEEDRKNGGRMEKRRSECVELEVGTIS